MSYAGRLWNVGAGLLARRGLARVERLSRDELTRLQRARLMALVAKAKRAPLWEERLAGVDGSELAAIPPITKDELMARFDESVTDPGLTRETIETWLETVGPRDDLHSGYRILASGGSSGRLGIFVYGADDWRGFLRGVFRWSKMMGLDPRLPRLRLASVSAPDAKHMTFRGAASIDVGVFRTLRLSATRPLDEIVEALNEFRPDFLFAYASMAALLADEQAAGRLRIAIGGACTTSELRTPDMTARIERAFGITPFDNYATTETGIAAVDCDEHAGLHVFEDLCILEVVDADGRAVPDGEPGDHVLVTNLNNATQPMIRVRVDDLLTVTSEPCACGRTLKRVTSLEGRADDVLTLPGRDGPIQMHPIQLRSPLADLRGLREYQIVHRAERLEIVVVPSVGAPPSLLESRACARLQSALTDAGVVGVAVHARSVARLDRGKGAAKLKLVRTEA